MYERLIDGYDTDIEKIFLEKLCEIKNNELREQVRISWLNDKKIYTSLTDKIEYEFIHYSLHDDSHSKCILEYIYLLIGEEKIKKFSVGDLWLLLEAAYSHDIGMFVTYEELQQIWQDDKTIKKIIKKVSVNSDRNAILVFNRLKKCIDGEMSKESALFLKENHDFMKQHPQWPLEIRKAIMLINSEYIRMKHPERSQNKVIDLLEKSEHLNMEKRLYKIVGKIDYLHGQDFSKVKEILEYESLGFSTDLIHPRMIALLLRVGDVLDVRNNRFDYWNILYFGGLPEDSQEHLEKHKSVTEFLISEETVSIRMESQKISTCVASRAWLDLVDGEMDHFICFWNSFVPNELKGVKIKKVDLVVLYKDQKFTLQDFQDNLKTDPSKLLKLLTGRNFYNTNLVAFREILQNAIDATKMKIASELFRNKTLHGNNDITDLKFIRPHDIQPELFENNDITINVNYAYKKGQNNNINDNIDENTVIFEIVDKGIGMDEEGLKALFHIGTGWRQRENIADLMEVIPGWLVPTGGFGIGILSTFLLSNKVVFETKSLQSPQYILSITSPMNGGKVEKIVNRNNYNPSGTTVRFKIDTALIIKELHEHVKINNDVSKRLTNLNILNKEDKIFIIMLLLKSLLEDLFVDYFFPIYINNEQFNYKLQLIGNKVDNLYACPNKFLKTMDNNKNNRLYSSILESFWNKEGNILVRPKILYDFIDGKDVENTSLYDQNNELKTRIGYKGIVINNSNISKDILNKKIMSFCNYYFDSIDIFDRNVDNVLEISLNNSTSNFKIEDVIKNLLSDYFEKTVKQIIYNKDKIKDNPFLQVLVNKFELESLALFINYNVSDIRSQWNELGSYFNKNYDYLTIEEVIQKQKNDYLNRCITEINKFADTINGKSKLLNIFLQDEESHINNIITEIKELKEKALNVHKARKSDVFIHDFLDESDDIVKKINSTYEFVKNFIVDCDKILNLSDDIFSDENLNTLSQMIKKLIDSFSTYKRIRPINYSFEKESLKNKLLEDKVIYCNDYQSASNCLDKLKDIAKFNEKMFYFDNKNEILHLDLLMYPNVHYREIIYKNNKDYSYYEISYKKNIVEKKTLLVDEIVEKKLYESGDNFIPVANIDCTGYESICVKNPLNFETETKDRVTIIYNPFLDGIIYGRANIRKIINEYDLYIDGKFSLSYIRKIYDESEYFNRIVDFVYHLNGKSVSVDAIKDAYCRLVYEVIKKIKFKTN